MTEMFIENKRLDITEELSALITYAVDDIRDFEHKQSNFSKTIVLPGTSNNNALFGHIFDARVSNSYDEDSDNVSTNFNPAAAADCIIFQNRMQVFKGTIRLMEIVVDKGQVEYEVSVFGELGSLVGVIGSGKLEDLDFSAYDHLWTASNVTGSWENVTGAGYYYPLIDYGTVSVAKVDYDIRTLRPALYVREYINKIVTDAGFTWESDLLNTSRFKSLIVPNNQQRFQSRTSNIFEVGVTEPYYLFNNLGGNLSPQFLNFYDEINLGSFTGSNLNTRFTYTGADTIVGETIIEVNFDFSHEDDQGTLTLDLYKNGVFIKEIGVFQDGTNITAELSGYQLGLSTNDYIEIKGTVTNTTGNDYYVYIYTGNWKINTAAEVWTDINYGDLININDSIPRNILQKDFLSSIVKLFNLYIYEDRLNSKKLYLKPYVDFYDYNASGMVDWTYKIDRSRPLRIKPMSEINSRYYNFNFKEDNDYYNELYRKTYNETYGNYIYNSTYEFANEKTEVSIIFSPTPLVGYAGVDKIVSAIYKKNAGVEERTASNIRILQAKKITGVTSWSIKNDTTTLWTGTVYGYAGHYDDPDAPANDIHFGVPRELYFTLLSGAVNVTQFNVYWSPYMAEITDKDSKLLTCYVKLTSRDIFNLDFSKVIYADGSVWRLSKIEDWNANDPDVCKVELLKIINMFY